MPAVDALKSFRSNGYGSKPEPENGEKTGMDSAEENSTSRIIKLSDDEQKAFANAKPGDDLACEVHGTLEDDGHFHVMSLAPMGGGDSYGDDKEMAGQVMQRVMPGVVPSPS